MNLPYTKKSLLEKYYTDNNINKQKQEINRKRMPKTIVQKDINGNVIAEYPSIRFASK